MSFRGRLRVFFAIIVVVPMVAIGIGLLSLTRDSETGKTDAALAVGLNVARAEYVQARSAARERLRKVAGDARLRRALQRRDRGAARQRVRALTGRGAGISVVVRPRGSAGFRVGPAGVAYARAAVETADGRLLARLALSSLGARGFVARVARETGQDALVVRAGRALASTEPGVRTAPRASGGFEAGGLEYRSRRERLGEEEVVVFTDAAAAQERLAESRLLIAGLLGLFLLLALITSSFLIRSLHSQIDRFLEAARQVAGGRFDQHVEPEGNDEFAQLAVEFNRMSAQLKDQLGEVQRKRDELEETIRRVGKAFATGLDRQGIVELTVQTAVSACEAEGGRALPLDLRVLSEVSAGHVDEACSAALERAERAAFAVQPDTGAELLSPVDDGPAPPDQRPPARGEYEDVYALALPLSARLGTRTASQFIGVLSIARRGRPFTEEESDLLRYLAGQAVVSIENADLHEMVRRQAVTDELTGLANVREMHGALDRELERLRRFEGSLGFVLLDIDDFKDVNDRYGHLQGDEVLSHVAGLLREVTRDIDEPARYGGEEFAVVVPGTDAHGAALLAERMREAIERNPLPGMDGHTSIAVTASFGVAAVPENAADKGSLIAAADVALYRAKRAGKNRVECAEAATVEGQAVGRPAAGR